MIVLGLNWTTEYYQAHETGASLIKDGKLVAAINEDRITNFKHDGPMPLRSLAEVLRLGQERGVNPNEIDFVAIPGRGVFASYLFGLSEMFSNRNISNVARIVPLMRQKKRLNFILNSFGVNAEIKYVDHHLSHAAASYYFSGFNDATVVTCDAIGYYTSGVFGFNGKQVKEIAYSKEAENSLGYFYSLATNAIGFHPFDGEGKTTGLACYGKPEGLDEIEKLVEIDGLKIKGHYPALGNKPVEVKEISKNGFDPYKHNNYSDSALMPFLEHKKKHGEKNLAACVQEVLEKRIAELVGNAVKETGSGKVCLGGGTFLNVKVNKKIREIPCVEDVFIFPNPGDAGNDAGAAIYTYVQESEKPVKHKLEHVYLGTDFSNDEIEQEINDLGLKYEKLNNPAKCAGDLIAENKVVGWFQGALEYGPRALGNRSVVADPRDPKMRDRINKYLKKRDWFMPFAPSMLDKAKEEYLVDGTTSPFMIMAFDVPKNKVSDFAAAVHVDGTTRPHTVKKETNEKYYELIKQFENNTGIPIVLNTSFNKHGHVIVRRPLDALNHLIWNCVEELIIGDFRVYKDFSKTKPT
jgi:carbamoyltransferase